MRVYLLLVTIAVILPLSACRSGAYNKSLAGQIKDLKQELQQVKEENRLLVLKLKEAERRYGIRFDQIQLEQRPQSSIFDRVFAEVGDASP
jgi:Tfp pilus assembly protein PilP